MFKPVEIQATAKQGAWLKQLSRSSLESHRVVERAQLLVYILSEGNVSNLKVEAALGVSQVYIKQWPNRWAKAQADLAHQEATLSEKDYEQALRQLLEDAPRSGAPIQYKEEQQCQLYGLACQSPQELGYPLSHWDSKSLRIELIKRGIVSDISVSTVSRFLKNRGTSNPIKVSIGCTLNTKMKPSLSSRRK